MKLFFILFTFWLILSGYFDLFFITSGIVSCIATLHITKILTNAASLNKDCIYYTPNRTLFSSILNSLHYFFWLIQQVTLSNIYIIKKVWNFKAKIYSPIFRIIQTKQTNRFSISILANSITLTPGTVSIDVIDSTPYQIRVLAIDETSMSSIVNIDNKIINIS